MTKVIVHDNKPSYICLNLKLKIMSKEKIGHFKPTLTPTIWHIVSIKSEDVESLKCIRDSFKGGAWFNTMAMQVLDRIIDQTSAEFNDELLTIPDIDTNTSLEGIGKLK